jgi:hypothetical protein
MKSAAEVMAKTAALSCTIRRALSNGEWRKGEREGERRRREKEIGCVVGQQESNDLNRKTRPATNCQTLKFEHKTLPAKTFAKADTSRRFVRLCADKSTCSPEQDDVYRHPNRKSTACSAFLNPTIASAIVLLFKLVEHRQSPTTVSLLTKK